jgi:aralkylamine N-acetyltransferase
MMGPETHMKSNDGKAVRYCLIRVPTDNQTRQIISLYRTQGWWEHCDDDKNDLVTRIVAGSHCFVVAAEGNTIIGMGRAISDGVSDAYIQDLTVLPAYRDSGIGGNILRLLLERLRAEGISWIGLIAEPGSRNLYERAGFREMALSVPMLLVEEP